MNSQNPPRLTGHDYDGIQEYDNPMPGWWSWGFALTVVFAAAYWLIACLAGPEQFGPRASYDAEVTADQERMFALMGEIGSDAASLMKLGQDEKLLQVGRAMFVSNCAACHGSNAGGVTGPNLTDESYMHVRQIEDFVDVIGKGRNNGAMPAWENRLRPKEITLLAAYVASLRGTNQPGRGPEGQRIAPWSAERK
jgi:cytochrome c oxidase cbb3-type subunit 3